MKLISKHRSEAAKKQPISISQAEITADLHYPESRESRRNDGRTQGRRGR